MKPKQTLIFLFFSIFGYSLMALAVYLYFNNPLYLSIAIGILGLSFISISFALGLRKNHNLTVDTSSDKTQIDIQPHNLSESDSLEETLNQQDIQVSMNNDEIQSLNVDEESISISLMHTDKYSNHYRNFEESSDANTILTKLDEAHINHSTLLILKDKLNTYGLAKRNPLFDYRFDLLLKSNLINTKIWEDLYEPFPSAKIIKQHLDNPGINVYLVKVSINTKNTYDLGYLPFGTEIPIERMVSVSATLIGGNYHYIDDKSSSFNLLNTPLSVSVKVKLK